MWIVSKSAFVLIMAKCDASLAGAVESDANRAPA